MVAINRKAAVNAIVSESVNDIAKKRRIVGSKRIRDSEKCSLSTSREVE